MTRLRLIYMVFVYIYTKYVTKERRVLSGWDKMCNFRRTETCLTKPRAI